MMSKRKLFLIGSGLAVLVGLGACLKAGDGVGLDSNGKPVVVAVDPCVAGPTSKACTTSTCLKNPSSPMCAVVTVDSCTLVPKPAGCPRAVAKTSFATAVWPIIQTNCITCHAAAGSAGSILDMETSSKALQNLVDKLVANQTLATGAPGWKRVVAGKPDSSMLLKKLQTKTNTAVRYDTTDLSRMYGNAMPLGLPKLPQANIDTIQKWILEGALP